MSDPPSAAYAAKTKYTEPVARRYFARPARKHVPEMKLMARACRFIPPQASVLDVPCGGGRVTVQMAQAGYHMTAADIAEGMLTVARENFAAHGLHIPVQQQDVEGLTLADGSYDAVVCFRLFHHLPSPEIRARVVGELCRVARRQVVISYFNAASVAAWQRRWRTRWKRKPCREYSTPLSELKHYFQQHGFQLVKDLAQRRFFHNLHLAVFVRSEETKT
ncbi:MAG: class I SAM-dependent methyltransferase [Verrucomicrobia bacterium]|jgi:2-polyprenyl-3-methyl-5-hydroxy-6-metoxy-1,4-benzoquinol methylase|nr:class I SAM-dependent methyltransferase [Verrucomicrobiota bacterium]